MWSEKNFFLDGNFLNLFLCVITMFQVDITRLASAKNFDESAVTALDLNTYDAIGIGTIGLSSCVFNCRSHNSWQSGCWTRRSHCASSCRVLRGPASLTFSSPVCMRAHGCISLTWPHSPTFLIQRLVPTMARHARRWRSWWQRTAALRCAHWMSWRPRTAPSTIRRLPARAGMTAAKRAVRRERARHARDMRLAYSTIRVTVSFSRIRMPLVQRGFPFSERRQLSIGAQDFVDLLHSHFLIGVSVLESSWTTSHSPFPPSPSPPPSPPHPPSTPTSTIGEAWSASRSRAPLLHR